MRLLRQSTQIDVVIGPVWATADGALKADLAYNASGINCDIYKGATKSDVTLTNSAGDGYFRAGSGEAQYILTLSTTHTNTLGMLRLTLSATGFYAKPEDFMVVPANVWDSLFGSDKLQVDTVQISGDDTAADNCELMFDGTGYAGGTTKLDVNTASISNGAITAATIATGAIDADAIADNAIDAGAIATGAITNAKFAAGAIDAAAIADAAIDAATFAAGAINAAAIAADAGTEIGAAVKTAVEAAGSHLALIKAKTDNLPTDPADDSDIDAQLATIAGYIDTEVAAILAAVDTEVAAIKAKTDQLNFTGTDVKATLDGETVTVATNNDKTGYALTAAYDAAKTAAAAGAKMDLVDAPNSTAIAAIQSGLATSSALSTVAGYVDTEVASIKGVTDKLDTALEADGGVYRLTANALEQAPSGSGATAQEVWEYTARTLTALDEDSTTLDLDATIAAAVPAASAIADAVLDEALSGHTTAGTLGKAVADTLADTNELQTNQGNWATATGFSTHSAADVVTAIGTGSTLTAVPWNAAWDAEVQSECTDALNAYDPPTKAELDAADDAVLALLGTAAGASIAADIAAVKAETAAILTDTGTTLDTLIKDIPTVAEFEARTIAAADYLTASDTLARVTLVDTCTTNTDMVAAAPSAADVAEAVRDVDNTSPAASSLGAAVNSASSAGDPWSTALPGAYGAGTAGQIVGDMDTVVAAIKAKTDNLPSDPADQSLLEAAIAAIEVEGGSVDAAAIAALVLAAIGAARVTITSPVASNGTITIYQGDDYVADEGRGLTFAIADATHLLGLDQEGASATLKLQQATWAATDITETTEGYNVIFEPTAEETAALTELRQSYELECVTAAGSVVTTHTGFVLLVRDIPVVS